MQSNSYLNTNSNADVNDDLFDYQPKVNLKRGLSDPDSEQDQEP